MTDLTSAVQRLESDESSTFVLFGNDLQIHTLLSVLKTADVKTTGTWIISGLSDVDHALVTQSTAFERFIVVHPDGSAPDLDIQRSFDTKVRTGGGPLYTSLYLQKTKCLVSKGDDCDFDTDLDAFFVVQNAVLPVFALAEALRAKIDACALVADCEGLPIVKQRDVDDVIKNAVLGSQILDKVILTKFSFFNHSNGELNKVSYFPICVRHFES